jgi:hypothetical protein
MLVALVKLTSSVERQPADWREQVTSLTAVTVKMAVFRVVAPCRLL